MLWLTIFILTRFIPCCVGSNGDMDPQYRYCMSFCRHKYIDNDIRGDIDKKITEVRKRRHGNEIQLGIYDNYIYQIPYFQLIELSYEDLCNYGCIEVITQRRLSNHLQVYKYQGHWPFIRYFGLEEPASSMFSLMNVIPHMLYIFGRVRAAVIGESVGSWSSSIINGDKIISKIRGIGHYHMNPWIIFYATTSCIAFTCSTIYHAKKTADHTKYDLISALLFITTGLFIAIRRIILRTHCSQVVIVSIFIIIYGLFSWRAYHMIHGWISFSSHMSLSITIVAITTVLWLYWIIKSIFFNMKSHQQQHRSSSNISSSSSSSSSDVIKGNASHQQSHIRFSSYICLTCQLWFIAAAAFEIFDFPPLYGVLDAHSLWHAATAPLGHLWYHFWEVDSNNNSFIIEEEDDNNHES